jgi:tetratricopeptide (TPR) repeat protein
MRVPLLAELFSGLPEDALLGIDELPADRRGMTGRKPKKESPGKARRRAVLHVFRQQALAKYTESTIARLTRAECPVTRQAAVFTLGLVGTMDSNDALAAALHDLDDQVARLAAAALWRVWARGDTPAQAEDLYRAVRVRDPEEAVEALAALSERCPGFAEAYNQKAIFLFRMGRYECAIRDCESASELNPHHFGALAGMGHCYLRMRQPEDALKALQSALRIHPRLDGVAATIRALENALEDEGR